MRTLFRGGYVVSVDKTIGNVKNCDVLVDGDRIVSVGQDLPVEGAEVIDATNCIILPGFVDVHRHTWQTQLRSAAKNWTLYDYLVTMRMCYPAFYTEDDAYLGNYMGGLDSINSGITTIVDHCHLCNSPEYVDRLIDGLDNSGIRGIWCYGWYCNPKYTPEFSLEQTPGWRYEDAKRIRRERLSNDSGRILFGVNPSEYDSAPNEVVVDELKMCRDLGAKVISAHVGMGYYDSGRGNVDNLRKLGLIDSDMLFVHCSALRPEEYEVIKQVGAGIACTPEVDMQMAMGHSPALRSHKMGIRTGLGLDITSNYASEMFTQMRVILADQRAQDNDYVAMTYRGIPSRLYDDADTALYLATMGGASAIHMEHEIGSITPGKKADIQLIRYDSPNMTPMNDPVNAVVHYANVGDIDTVMVDGVIRKQGGKLVNINWSDIAAQAEKSVSHIMEDSKIVNTEFNRGFWQQIFGGHVYVGDK